MADSFVFQIDWTIVASVIGVLALSITAFCMQDVEMTSRRFPPWSIDELEACFIVKDNAGTECSISIMSAPPPSCTQHRSDCVGAYPALSEGL
jgi:hypothetical protein